MHRSKKLLLNSLVVGVLLVPIFAYAQATSVSSQEVQSMVDKLLEDQRQQLLKATEAQQNITSNTLDVKIKPSNPEASVPVIISVESYTSDLYKADISWSVNNKALLKGVGETSFTFQNGKGGQTTVVSLRIVTNTGEVINKDFSFTPTGITVLWEADTYTPPFYKGKAMMVPQATVRIVAVSDTNPTSAKLVYTWGKNNYTDAGASGYGKNVYTFDGPEPLTSTRVSLSVSSLDDKTLSDSQIFLPQKRPFILFYEKDPLLGIMYNKPIGAEYALTGKELSLSAEPYFFSNDRDVTLPHRYLWSINGEQTMNKGREITLRNDKGVNGDALLSFSIRAIAQNYQTAEKKLKIIFSENSLNKPIF